ncbi:hypothetical protein E8E11_004205 [Didymella keratinophila]|nr:hypothetical protein E8E11_004205 [Didymella keratinophila]
MAEYTYGDYCDNICSACLQKDERIRQLEIELFKTTKAYHGTQEKKLQDTEKMVEELESETGELKKKISNYEEQLKAAETKYHSEVANIKACNEALHEKKAALHEKEAAYEKLKILLQKNEEDARDLREEMDRTNKVLQTQLLAAEMENKRLLNDLSDTRKQNERLQEALKQANDTNSAGLDTPTVRSNNSQTETAHVLTNGI